MFVEGSWHVVVCSEARVDRSEPLLCVGPLPPSCPQLLVFTEVAPNWTGFRVLVKFTLGLKLGNCYGSTTASTEHQ